MKKFENGNRIEYIKTVFSFIILIFSVSIIVFYHKADNKAEDILLGLTGSAGGIIFGHGLFSVFKKKENKKGGKND